ncbi:MAG: inositol-3-phosphate synthase [Candidatus Bathyarchaeia archaeon]
MAKKIRVALVGIGNCASALVQGVHLYKSSEMADSALGLLQLNLGGYRPGDIEFVAAFDVDSNKVGKDLSEAIFQRPNNTRRMVEPPRLGVPVLRGPVLDGLGRFVKPLIKTDPSLRPVDVAQALKEAEAEILINYLPVGSEAASRFYAKEALKARCGFINAIPVFIASSKEWQRRFKKAGLPLAGDDVMSQLGATVLHKTLAKLLVERGVKVEESYQLNIGGDTDFLNMLEEGRLKSKRESKTSAVKAMIPYDIPLRIGPSDYVEFLANKKICYIWIKGSYFGGTPLSLDVKLEVWDAPNSAGVIIDVVRVMKVALDRGIAGPLTSISAYAFKHPPIQLPYEVAKKRVQEFLEGLRQR